MVSNFKRLWYVTLFYAVLNIVVSFVLLVLFAIAAIKNNQVIIFLAPIILLPLVIFWLFMLLSRISLVVNTNLAKRFKLQFIFLPISLLFKKDFDRFRLQKTTYNYNKKEFIAFLSFWLIFLAALIISYILILKDYKNLGSDALLISEIVISFVLWITVLGVHSFMYIKTHTKNLKTNFKKQELTQTNLVNY